jgi:lambda family phage portal protein
MNVVARAASALRGRFSAPAAQPPARSPSAQYFRRGQSQFLAGWRPNLRDAREDVSQSYTDAAARAIDTLHNSGWIAGAVTQAVASTVGVALRLSALPDRMTLGWTDKEANDWARLVERRWVMWSENPIECDAGGRYTMGQLTASMLRSYFSHGEGLALLPFMRRSISLTGTKVQLLPAHKLAQDTLDHERLFNGVRVDSYGLPLAYRLKRDERLTAWPYVDVAARDGAGRPQVVHVFEGEPGQTRGITPLAPALRVIAQFDQLQDATLTAALIQAIFAATIESDTPSAEVLDGLKEQAEGRSRVPAAEASLAESGLEALLEEKVRWYEDTKIDLGTFGKIAHLFVGEKLKFNRSEHPNGTYEAFANFLQREIGRSLGLTFEQYTGDYRGATYSSVRMAGAENWPIVMSRRTNICGRFCQAAYEAWLEEEIEAGRVPYPGGFMAFLAQRPAVVLAEWRGPAKPQADDLKAAKAHEVYKRLGVVTDQMICADLGVDFEDVYEQRAREAEMRAQLKLPEGDAMTPDPVGDALMTEPVRAAA